MKQDCGLSAIVAFAISFLGGLSACSYPSLAPYQPLELKGPSPAQGELSAQFLGVTTILFSDGTTSIMTDGFFSRPPALRMALGKIGPDEAWIDYALRRSGVTKAGVSKLDALLVAHSHYDHALDSGRVAKLTDARLVGTASTRAIGLAASVPEDRIKLVSNGKTLHYGAFAITAIQSPHSPGAWFPGVIEPPIHPPTHVSSYKEGGKQEEGGGNYSFLIRHGGIKMLFQPSANAVPERFRGVEADVVFLGIGTLGLQSAEFAECYWDAVVRGTGAKLVVPTHWDAFNLPLHEPLQPMPKPFDDFDTAMRMILVLANRDGVAVRFMPIFETIGIATALRQLPARRTDARAPAIETPTKAMACGKG
ncbi:MAG: MBL fold metallo-hydrolase [Rhodospirillales bacterium]|nr:MBL fold metallo-hydrolase [Rhodospirillales bacterium]